MAFGNRIKHSILFRFFFFIFNSRSSGIFEIISSISNLVLKENEMEVDLVLHGTFLNILFLDKRKNIVIRSPIKLAAIFAKYRDISSQI